VYRYDCINPVTTFAGASATSSTSPMTATG
jgi:hypothetical protein